MHEATTCNLACRHRVEPLPPLLAGRDQDAPVHEGRAPTRRAVHLRPGQKRLPFPGWMLSHARDAYDDDGRPRIQRVQGLQELPLVAAPPADAPRRRVLSLTAAIPPFFHFLSSSIACRFCRARSPQKRRNTEREEISRSSRGCRAVASSWLRRWPRTRQAETKFSPLCASAAARRYESRNPRQALSFMNFSRSASLTPSA